MYVAQLFAIELPMLVLIGYACCKILKGDLICMHLFGVKEIGYLNCNFLRVNVISKPYVMNMDDLFAFLS